MSLGVLLCLACCVVGAVAVRKRHRDSRDNISARWNWDWRTLDMTHYWDCSGQDCDANTLQPWSDAKYVSPPGYGPQDPNDFGGGWYGEKMWLTGAASDALSGIMGSDEGCCGSSDEGACGQCLLVQVQSARKSWWKAVVMKKNRCPPWSNGCERDVHFDIAVPGFDNLDHSTANVCGNASTGFRDRAQSGALGKWYERCWNTAQCSYLCDRLESQFRKGCRLFASWGWTTGSQSGVRFRAVECPTRFTQYVSGLFDANGVVEESVGRKQRSDAFGRHKPWILFSLLIMLNLLETWRI